MQRSDSRIASRFRWPYNARVRRPSRPCFTKESLCTRRLRPVSAAAAVVTILALCGPITRVLSAQSFGNAIQTAETERFLIDAPIVRLGKTLGGVTYSRQAILELDGVTRFGVWKTIDEKKGGLTEFAGGRGGEVNFQDSWRTEIPAYELDKLLGLNMVPATVARTHNGVQGSLQAWVDLGMSEAERLRKKISAPDLEGGTARCTTCGCSTT